MYLEPTILIIISLFTYIPMRQTDAKDAEHTTVVAAAMIQNAHDHGKNNATLKLSKLKFINE